ncbi:MAG: hypothetical protein IJ723_07935 [Ruminococcus sp.]|nr:hypothetical protein [Ruminococcus sp.]
MGLFGETYEVTFTKNGVTQTIPIKAKNMQKAKEKFGEKYGKCDNVKFKRKK